MIFRLPGTPTNNSYAPNIFLNAFLRSSRLSAGDRPAAITKQAMSRRTRVHVDGGTYYVVQQGTPQRPVFSSPDDCAEFARILAAVLPRTRTTIHAYACLPLALNMVVQVDRMPLGRFMQALTSRYGRAIHRRTCDSGHFFQQRYRAVLIEPARYLSRLVRYVDALATIDEAPPEDVELFARALNMVALGSPEFLAALPRGARPYRTRASFDDIVRTVTSRFALDAEQVFSRSRERRLTLARAVIAWYATERGAATLTEVAGRFRRDPSTLSSAISRYRASRPELFRLATLHDIASLAPVSASAPQRIAVAASRRDEIAPC
jgi:putative transposase